jgi:hypothetical protein
MNTTNIDEAVKFLYEIGDSFVMHGYYGLPENVFRIVLTELIVNKNKEPLGDYHELKELLHDNNLKVLCVSCNSKKGARND